MASSIVSKKARVHRSVKIGHCCRIHDNVVLEKDCVVEDFTTLGYPTAGDGGAPLVIRRGSLIRSYSLFYEGSEFGARLVTGHRVTVREMTRAGENLQIGTLCDIQGHCTIGDYVRMHSSVHVAQGSWIGDFCWLFPYVVLTNDPHPPSDGYRKGCRIENFAVLSTSACILPGIVVGEGALVGAGALVSRDVKAGRVVAGNPARDVGPARNVLLRDDSGRAAYPWRRHFHRGYPDEIVEAWSREFQYETG
ncbi:MAG: dTDP-3-amino-3,6-dideoxy-alpha-D-galactopyranose 3-N-acetyltransferase [Syntrophaceae bacterium PtaU1.Bin231]|nr:MAG: dTDP-3-amino-3,6-dideoxy-alpha-D-galactopyranose 3-N-acetyltransferase [Syntrophaceae bacterium PtaU1.Bin231]